MRNWDVERLWLFINLRRGIRYSIFHQLPLFENNCHLRRLLENLLQTKKKTNVVDVNFQGRYGDAMPTHFLPNKDGLNLDDIRQKFRNSAKSEPFLFTKAPVSQSSEIFLKYLALWVGNYYREGLGPTHVASEC